MPAIIDQAMHGSAINDWKEIGWGTLASVALHLTVAVLLISRIHIESYPLEETVAVELVEPLPAKPKDKPQQQPASVRAARPMVFESMPDQPEQKDTEPERPVATQAPTPPTDAGGGLTNSRSDTERDEPKPAAPADTKTDPQNVPVPEQKARPDEANIGAAEKPAVAKSKQKSDESIASRERASPKSLFDPRVMQAFGQLPREGRIRQLCTIEALDRIRQQAFGRYTDILVPYGTTGGRITNNTLDARGGAFRSGSNWYNVNFTCKVDADTTKVVSFRLGIGGAVPRSEWSKRELPLD